MSDGECLLWYVEVTVQPEKRERKKRIHRYCVAAVKMAEAIDLVRRDREHQHAETDVYEAFNYDGLPVMSIGLVYR